MRVKILDEQHELDLEEAINDFIEEENCKVLDIKFSTTSFCIGSDQIFCFSALILYE